MKTQENISVLNMEHRRIWHVFFLPVVIISFACIEEALALDFLDHRNLILRRAPEFAGGPGADSLAQSIIGVELNPTRTALTSLALKCNTRLFQEFNFQAPAEKSLPCKGHALPSTDVFQPYAFTNPGRVGQHVEWQAQTPYRQMKGNFSKTVWNREISTATRLSRDREVTSKFRLLSDRSYSFDIGPYPSTYTLVIDPTLEFSTYIGGSSPSAQMNGGFFEWGKEFKIGGKPSDPHEGQELTNHRQQLTSAAKSAMPPMLRDKSAGRPLNHANLSADFSHARVFGLFSQDSTTPEQQPDPAAKPKKRCGRSCKAGVILGMALAGIGGALVATAEEPAPKGSIERAFQQHPYDRTWGIIGIGMGGGVVIGSLTLGRSY